MCHLSEFAEIQFELNILLVLIGHVRLCCFLSPRKNVTIEETPWPLLFNAEICAKFHTLKQFKTNENLPNH